MDHLVPHLRIAILGCGFMGTAILQGLLAKTKGDDENTPHYSAWVRSSTSLDRLRQALGGDQSRVSCVAGTERLVETISSSDVVILGFPPDQLDSVINDVELAKALCGKLIISLLAGASYDKLFAALNKDAKQRPPESNQEDYSSQYYIIRAIPSIGAKINASVTLLAVSESARSTDIDHTTWIFNHLGQIQWLPESLMDEATAAGAVCHALAVVTIDAIVDACVAEGIPRAMALKFAPACLQSAAGMVLEGGMTPEVLKEAMSVPKGITINAVLNLQKGGVGVGTSEAVRSAIEYTRGMAS